MTTTTRDLIGTTTVLVLAISCLLCGKYIALAFLWVCA